MNVETGALYEGLGAIRAAEARGESIIRIGERAAAVIRAGLAQQARAKHARARKVAKQSRKRNRA